MQSKLTLEQVFSLWASEAFARAFPGVACDGGKLAVGPATDERFGDYQCNGAMEWARIVKQKPRDVAAAALAALPLPECAEKAEIAGPGFINFFVKPEWAAAALDALQGDDALGTPCVGAGKTVVLDYSSPNVAKPMHIGHIRSTVIGNALDRLHRFLGYRVIADNHLGDWGTQFGILTLGYRHFVDQEALKSEPAEELERVYVKSYERSKADEEWLAAARGELVKLQGGDEKNLALWKMFVDLSMEEFGHIYGRLGVSFDLVRGESYYNDKLRPLVEDLVSRGLARKSEGALVVFLDDEKLDPCLVQKSDGAYNYATTDLATVKSRIDEFHPDKIIYVTDERQQLHFRQIFAVCGKLGWSTPLVHVWFGLMRLPQGTFSTRQGNVIKLEKLLDEAEARALEMVRQSSPEMPADQQKEVARAVGLGAVKYADLSQNPQSLVTFTWEKALALEGNSAPYLQYAYARIASVQDKYRERFPGKEPRDTPIRIDDPLERKLALRLLRFPDVVIRAASLYRPNLLADYLYDLAQVYSSFYQNVPFLKAEEGVRESRVRLCDQVAKTLGRGLNLLGIDTPSRI